jgi:hypothetical protein
LLFVAPEPSSELDADGTPVKSVIDNYELAEKKYTAAYLYAVNKCRAQAKKDTDSVDKALYTERLNAAKREYESLDDGKKALWEGKRREHLLRQPAIKDQIIDAIRKNPKKSWSGIEADINFWCSAATIYRWITSMPGYHLYCERVIPLLTDAQRMKHYVFARRFLNNWGLGAGKYLLIEYDEKWFWGLVMRRAAKSCADLGINPQSYKAYHKSHIAKTMGIAFPCNVKTSYSSRPRKGWSLRLDRRRYLGGGGAGVEGASKLQDCFRLHPVLLHCKKGCGSTRR